MTETTIDSPATITRLGVVGTGTMGRGIAQVAAVAGLQVTLLDQRAEAALEAVKSIGATLDAGVARGKLTAAERDATLARIACATNLGDLRPCDVVVEAIVEDLAIKQELLRALEDIVRDDAILATNTSSLSVTALQCACRLPGRVVGWHFFNPVPLMRIAEIIEGERTHEASAAALIALTNRFGHTPVRAKDMPGFVVNHVGRALIPEGLRLLSEGAAEFHTIDTIMKEAAGFRMGPFELADLVGLDVAEMVMTSLYDQFQQEPRFRITPLVSRRVAAGLLGRKTRQGFYAYDDAGKAIAAPAALPVEAPASLPRVWICPAQPDLAQRVRDAVLAAGGVLDNADHPAPDSLIVTTPLGEDVSTHGRALGLDPQRTVGVDAVFPLERRITVMHSPATGEAWRAAAQAIFSTGTAAVSVLRDTPGFVAQRIVAQIVSIGCDIAQQRIASPAEIDTAARLALGYPKGPFELGDAIGARRVLAISDALYDAYRDPRYRASVWLRRRATLGLSLFTPD
jgi:3-hydroxybutyryl-CoA dehydrogenase